MNVLSRLASSLGRRDEVPNQQLAKQIAKASDENAAKELVQNLSNKDKNIQSDCIKVLYEIGYRKPALISPYCEVFLSELESNSHRIVWGAMIALDTITPEAPEQIFNALPRIIQIADSGSVITRDHAVGILIKLAGTQKYADKAFTLLLEQLKKAPTNQLPMYAENAHPVIHEKNKTQFAKILSSRLPEVEAESKRKRIEAVLRKAEKSTRPES